MQAGKYVWKTYKEVYDLVIKVVNAIRTCGVEEVSFLVLLEDFLILFISIFALTYLLLMVYREENVVFTVSIAQSGLSAWR